MSDQVFRHGPQRYATGQLSRALTAIVRAGANKAERRRAEAKAQRWREVLDGLASGRVTVGSRTPVADLPAWVTLEVAHGGFTTGRGLAEAPLTRDEAERVADLPAEVPGDNPRERLNLWYLGDAGQAQLLAALRSGHYRIQLPEHAALLVVALLLDKGFPEQALDLVAELRPYMSRLRFTPAFDLVARPSGAAVRVATVAEAADALRGVRTPEQLTLMHATIEVWTPLYDRLVALWCATVDGDLPSRDRTGTVIGGLPGSAVPPHWMHERARWLADFESARTTHEFRGHHAHRKSNFTHLHEALLSIRDEARDNGSIDVSSGTTARMSAGPAPATNPANQQSAAARSVDSQSANPHPGAAQSTDADTRPARTSLLNPHQVDRVRRALANTLARHGEPGSAARESARAEQAAAIAAPLYTDFAGVLLTRIERFPADGGLPSLDPVTTPVGADDRVAIADGTTIPQHLQDKAIRALEAPAEELVQRGIVGSGEVLAAMLPQLTSRLLAADIADPVAASLYEQMYTAFRQRRSLLLLNLQYQVRFDELPWVTALHALRTATGTGKPDDATRAGSSDGLRSRKSRESRDGNSGGGSAAARRLLRQTTLLAIESFPEAVLPNPLVREFHTLAEQAGLRVPLVEEVAADIFMGTFTEKWRAAAIIASRTLTGTLYQRYYDLPSADHWRAGARSEIRWGKSTATDFTELCARRAVEAGTRHDYVARNGALLEQSQILTTHNLVVLVDALDLGEQLRESAPDLANRTFDWIIRRLSQPAHGHAALIQVKNAAYAWRQAVFLLSYCDLAGQTGQIDRLIDQHAVPRLEPAVAGLAHIVAGGRFAPNGLEPNGAGRRLLGWAVGRHWYFG
ncbi:hypothetical protein [Nocardia sp. NPDC004860]|uniref:hypothetical protein n=1 Tax=Nocardia sp. NPDC004860 TaxID=3154557 RepID=UPI0033BF8768